VFERKETGLFSMENVRRTNAFFDRFGALAVILARFVPIVRTFAPVAAGVGHMNYKKYSVFNAIGALIWGAGLTLFGYVIGYIPPVANFVSDYIDVILIGAVVVTLIPTLFHYFQTVRKSKKNRLAQQQADQQRADQQQADKQRADQEQATQTHPAPTPDI
jgi:membrane-associated protein